MTPALLRYLPAVVVVLAASVSSAAIISRDWKTPGDGLLTYDTVNQREWLDFPVSLLSQYGATIDSAVPLAKLELQPGGRFDGFTLAKPADVLELVASAGVDVSTDALRKQTAGQMLQLITLLGPILGDVAVGDAFTTGVVDLAVSPPPVRGNANFGARLEVQSRYYFPPDGFGVVGFVADDDLYGPSTTGLALYRPTVPECITSCQIIITIGSFLLFRSFKKQNLAFPTKSSQAMSTTAEHCS